MFRSIASEDCQHLKNIAGATTPAITIDIYGQQRLTTYDDVRNLIHLPPWHQCLEPKHLKAAQGIGLSEHQLKLLQLERAAGTGFRPALRPGGRLINKFI